jgi:hypothetical protein
MIHDLKEDSARWDFERRAQVSRNTIGDTHVLRDGANYLGVPCNTDAVQYRYSETHQSRLHRGPTEDARYH